MNILIAEDTFEVLNYLQNFFEESGHTVFSATDGEEALEIFKKGKIDGIFCELTLPKLGGLELLNEVKSNNCECPFVMICPHEDSVNALGALQLGACDFLMRNINNKDLQRTLDRVISLREGFHSEEYGKSFLLQETKILEIGNDFEGINRVVAFISKDLTHYCILSQEQLFRMNMLLKESIDNAIFHGNLGMDSHFRRDNPKMFYNSALQKRDMEPYKDRKVSINYEISINSAKYVIRDEGKGFTHTKMLDRLDPDNLMQIEGRGLVMIMNFMDEVFWNERGNEITMVRYKKRKS